LKTSFLPNPSIWCSRFPMLSPLFVFSRTCLAKSGFRPSTHSQRLIDSRHHVLSISDTTSSFREYLSSIHFPTFFANCSLSNPDQEFSICLRVHSDIQKQISAGQDRIMPLLSMCNLTIFLSQFLFLLILCFIKISTGLRCRVPESFRLQPFRDGGFV
jgi:hypothetical protein